ncbi:MAG: hypothetical protein SFT94_01830 [Pseudanabaenaceae cyanobacterium bins.68]|nr:hypothetical protein [Pseudanabaenaceae cyanobacterium bins.68]
MSLLQNLSKIASQISWVGKAVASTIVTSLAASTPFVLADQAYGVNFNQPIDTFSSPLLITGYTTPTVINQSGTNIYEGQRDILITPDTTINNAVAGIGQSSGQDFYLLGVGSTISGNTIARSSILYDGTTATANPLTSTPASFSGSLNLTTDGVNPINGLRLRIFSTNDAKSGSQVSFTVFSGSNSSTLTQPLTLGNTTAYDLDFLYSGFTGTADFTNVTAIRFDATLVADNFEPATVRFNFVDAVPFEYSQELGLVAVAGLFGAYKFKKAQVKQSTQPESKSE